MMEFKNDKEVLDYIAGYILPVIRIDGKKYVTLEVATHLKQTAKDALVKDGVKV